MYAVMDTKDPISSWQELQAGYPLMCVKIARQFLEDKTHHGSGDLERVGDASYTLRKFRVTVEHIFTAQSSQSTHAGSIARQPNDVLCASGSQYNALAREMLQVAANSPQAREIVQKALNDSSLGRFPKSTSVWTEPRRAVYTHACGACSGAGQLQCSVCAGSGRTRCHTCSGTTQIYCPMCAGSGGQVSTAVACARPVPIASDRAGFAAARARAARTCARRAWGEGASSVERVEPRARSPM